MDLRATYAEDGVVLTDQLPAKAASPRPATDADLFSGAGPSARPSPATVTGLFTGAGPSTRPGTLPTSAAKARVSDFSVWMVTADEPAQPRRPRAVVDEDGFTLVQSRKRGMVRGLNPDVEIALPDVEAGHEIPCGFKFGGSVRMIRKWYQGRKTLCAVNEQGPGTVVFGSYGGDGHEY